jgi:hypothetical protein
MSILNVPLRKLLSLFYANDRLRRKILLADIGSDARKEGYLIYPYFSEAPSLPVEGARLGLWAMSQALSQQPLDYLRIVDLLRKAVFSTTSLRLTGDEGDILLRRYQALILERERLKERG